MLAIYCRTSREKENDGVSTITQQVKVGIEFAKKKGFDFKVYEDEGKSGYKIKDDDDLFANRPGFLNLLDDIKTGIIDKVWVWEQSRLSRNQLSTAHIFSIFQKNKVTLFEKDKEYNINDPQVKLMMGIFGSVAEYEREQIVARIKRGIHDRIDMGKRNHGKIYGYSKTGIDDNGYQIIEPVESEIELLKIMFADYLKGNTLISIANKVKGKSKSEKRRLQATQTIKLLLKHFEYTGYSLNTKGIEILKKYDDFEIDSLSELMDSQYYNPSSHYKVKIVSIENWVKVRERLRLNRKAYNDKPETRTSNKSISTGLIKCGFCNSSFYNKNLKKTKLLKSGELKTYNNFGYHHHIKIERTECSQYPKSFTVEKIDNVFKLFFFYFYLVFDNTKELIEESQKDIKIKISELEESVKSGEKELSGIKKQISKFNDIVESDTSIEKDIIVSLLNRIKDLETREGEKSKKLTNNEILLEQEREKYSNNEKRNAYYNTKDKILTFFDSNVEMQRNELRQIITDCFIYNQYLIIVANKRLFLFNITNIYSFDEKAMKNLIDDKVFMKNFTKGKGDSPIIEFESKMINGASVSNINLKYNRDKLQKIFKKYNIDYNLKDIEYFISLENVGNNKDFTTAHIEPSLLFDFRLELKK
jgi:site-specific DNA recombinase